MISSKLDPLYNARSCRGGFYKQSMPEIDRLINPPLRYYIMQGLVGADFTNNLGLKSIVS